MSSNQPHILRIDLLITALVTGLVCWFIYQHGYANTPDSYYRGILAKSIIEGHPYFIHMRQGWLYDSPIWHHNAGHEPLLPLIYAISFLIFGFKISIANVVSSISAGLFIFPLLQLSRRLNGSAIIGFLIYLAIVLNEGISYYFEAHTGLSIPTYTLLLALFLLNFDVVLHNTRSCWIWTCALIAAGFYLTRGEAQPLLFLVAIISLLAAPRFIDTPAVKRIRRVWLLSLLLISPWVIRKIILFGSPFFSHLSPILWADDAYDYWRYPESGEYPSRLTYFGCHTVADFLEKIFVTGPRGFYFAIERALPGPAWLYPLIILISLTVIWLMARDQKRRYLFLVLSSFIFGYIVLFSLVPVYDARYLIAPFFLTALAVSIAISHLFAKFFGSFKTVGIYATIIVLAAASVPMQMAFWKNFQGYLRYAYTTSDQLNETDNLVIKLKERFPVPSKVTTPILGPFAEVQRLSFLTDLPLVEVPVNLKELTSPRSFFERYGIHYSLVDISKLFPDAPDVKWTPIGNRLLFEVPEFEGTDSFSITELQADVDSNVTESISHGVQARLVFVTEKLSSTDLPYEYFKELGIKTRIFKEEFCCRERELLQSGLLILSYRGGMQSLSTEELGTIYKFLDNGGRLFILCPGWVWTSYENKGLGELPYNQILEYFSVAITQEYISPPYVITDPLLGSDAVTSLVNLTASELIYGRSSTPLIIGANERALAVRTKKNNARAVIWGHNYLLGKESLATPSGKDTLKRVLDWLFATN